MNDLQVLFKSNALIKAKYDFTVSQNRVLQKAFYEIQKNKINVAKITLQELKSLIKFKDYSTVEGIKRFLENLKENEIMHIKDNGEWLKVQVISGYKYNPTTKIFKIEIPMLLLQLIHEYTQTGFTPTNVTKYIGLGATNAQRLYELLRMWTGNKTIIEYSVDEIKEYLMLQNKYKVFNNFRVRVIESAVKELREKELLDIYNVEYVKTGRKVTSIKFYVKDLEPRIYKFETKKNFDKPKKEVSSFANFTQRKYDYDKLEKQLLGWADDEEDYEER
ncbi:replication initiation protein [Sarcina ventriculi]|uniref:replication initiation protein n=1 Tax=Sarcina ventriculi TaxID=1267 RepID=UPI001C108DE9|nr:replication initiation protein [Sarcina ventriculi]MBU5323532.1 replication initiation protein [Sarcina ventriculi]